MDERKFINYLYKHYDKPNIAKRNRKPDVSYTDNEDANNLLNSSPNAFLIGALFDTVIKYEKAWEVPYHLKKRMGHLNIERISKMKKSEMVKYLSSPEYGPVLHRFYRTKAEYLIYDCKLLVDEYNGKAENIWREDPRAGVVLDNLRELKGVGQKLSMMIIRMLATDYGIKLNELDRVDIPVDRHVARVFLRTGLIPSQYGKTEYAVSELRNDIIEKARELSPDFPAAIDEPVFSIGREWCTQEMAYCSVDGYKPCPLNKICSKRKRNFIII